VPGVLVLVEQHRPVGGALGGPHLGVLGRHPRRDRQLVAEVDGPLRTLARRERLDER
jgi:hypothetical protein